MEIKNKGGRPRESKVLSKAYKDSKDYNKEENLFQRSNLLFYLMLP